MKNKNMILNTSRFTAICFFLALVIAPPSSAIEPILQWEKKVKYKIQFVDMAKETSLAPPQGLGKRHQRLPADRSRAGRNQGHRQFAAG